MPRFAVATDYHWIVQLFESGPPFDRDPLIELSDAEYADYQRVEAEYQAWRHRLCNGPFVERKNPDTVAGAG